MKFPNDIRYGQLSNIVSYEEVLTSFFEIYNVIPKWSDCNDTYGWLDDSGNWTGCLGQVIKVTILPSD